MASNEKEPSNNGNFRSNRQMNDSYQVDGYKTKECLKEVIEDHQKKLFLAPNGDRYNSVDIPVYDIMELASQKLDKLVVRVANIERKMERIKGAKSEYGEAAAIGAGISIACIGLDYALPHVVAGIGELWNTVKTSMKS